MKVHELSCENLGKFGIHPCQCPTRLASGTVQSLLGQLKTIFEAIGTGISWNELNNVGNPVCSQEIQRYLRSIKLKQSKSHVVSEQAKLLFLGKPQSISWYIDDLLQNMILKSSDKFVLLRDQAFFNVQYFFWS